MRIHTLFIWGSVLSNICLVEEAEKTNTDCSNQGSKPYQTNNDDLYDIFCFQSVSSSKLNDNSDHVMISCPPINTVYNSKINSMRTPIINSNTNPYNNSLLNSIIDSTVNSSYNFTFNSTNNSTPNPCNNSTLNTFINSTVNASNNSTLNTFINSTVNSNYNSTFNPSNNSTVNSSYNYTFNPSNNSTVNSSYNYTFNPSNNSTSNPFINSTINPFINSPFNPSNNYTPNSFINSTYNTIINSTHYTIINTTDRPTTSFNPTSMNNFTWDYSLNVCNEDMNTFKNVIPPINSEMNAMQTPYVSINDTYNLCTLGNMYDVSSFNTNDACMIENSNLGFSNLAEGYEEHIKPIYSLEYFQECNNLGLDNSFTKRCKENEFANASPVLLEENRKSLGECSSPIDSELWNLLPASDMASDKTKNVKNDESENDGKNEIENDVKDEIENDGEDEIENDGEDEIENDGDDEIENDGDDEIENDGDDEIENDGDEEEEEDNKDDKTIMSLNTNYDENILYLKTNSQKWKPVVDILNDIFQRFQLWEYIPASMICNRLEYQISKVEKEKEDEDEDAYKYANNFSFHYMWIKKYSDMFDNTSPDGNMIKLFFHSRAFFNVAFLILSIVRDEKISEHKKNMKRKVLRKKDFYLKRIYKLKKSNPKYTFTFLTNKRLLVFKPDVGTRMLYQILKWILCVTTYSDRKFTDFIEPVPQFIKKIMEMEIIYTAVCNEINVSTSVHIVKHVDRYSQQVKIVKTQLSTVLKLATYEQEQLIESVKEIEEYYPHVIIFFIYNLGALFLICIYLLNRTYEQNKAFLHSFRNFLNFCEPYRNPQKMLEANSIFEKLQQKKLLYYGFKILHLQIIRCFVDGIIKHMTLFANMLSSLKQNDLLIITKCITIKTTLYDISKFIKQGRQMLQIILDRQNYIKIIQGVYYKTENIKRKIVILECEYMKNKGKRKKKKENNILQKLFQDLTDQYETLFEHEIILLST